MVSAFAGRHPNVSRVMPMLDPANILLVTVLSSIMSMAILG